MAPWKFTKYLHEIKDFENLEYRSKINVWNNSNNPFENDLAKVQFIEFDLSKGSIVHIPNYWWYSIQYKDDTNVNILLEFNYRSFINHLSNLWDYSKFLLQNQNIIKNFTKKVTEQNNEQNEGDVEEHGENNDFQQVKEEENE